MYLNSANVKLIKRYPPAHAPTHMCSSVTDVTVNFPLRHALYIQSTHVIHKYHTLKNKVIQQYNFARYNIQNISYKIKTYILV